MLRAAQVCTVRVEIACYNVSFEAICQIDLNTQ